MNKNCYNKPSVVMYFRFVGNIKSKLDYSKYILDMNFPFLLLQFLTKSFVNY